MAHCVTAEDCRSRIQPVPWDCRAARNGGFRNLTNQLGGGAIVIAAFDKRRPASDEVLATAGVKSDALRRWLNRLPEGDLLYQKALGAGSAQGHEASLFTSPGSRRSTSTPPWTAYLTAPGSYTRETNWFVAVSRPGGRFPPHEIDALRRVLHQWASRFNSPTEPGMARFIAGRDDRIILIDPGGEQILIDDRIDVAALMRDLRDVAKQRWPDLVPNQGHDVVMDIAGRTRWIRFHESNPAGEEAGGAWYVEMRPLEEGEMTPVGDLQDERIARAIAYIHDHYCESPSLEDVASKIGISLFHFHRLFSRHVGITPKQYILQKQIQVARWLLRAHRTPVSEVAEKTGFASHGHFTSTFSRMVGMSPTAYREHSRIE